MGFKIKSNSLCEIKIVPKQKGKCIYSKRIKKKVGIKALFFIAIGKYQIFFHFLIRITIIFYKIILFFKNNKLIKNTFLKFSLEIMKNM
jgi:hypothetical protein